jgi:hypothetical protein
MKKTGWKVSEGGKVVTRRQLEHSLNQLAQTFIKGLMQMEEHFDARLKQMEKAVQHERPWECPDYGPSCGGLLCSGEARHTWSEDPAADDVKVPA